VVVANFDFFRIMKMGHSNLLYKIV